MKNLSRQDRNGTRNSEELRRRYQFKDIDYTKDEIEKLKMKIITDNHLSATSTNPIQNKVVTNALNTKVNKETGKGLSSNDYTDEEKNKVSSIPDNIETTTNKVTSIDSTSTDTQYPSAKAVFDKITAIQDKVVEDTGWINATLTSSFQAYNDNDDNIPKYRKIDKIVEIVGVITPSTTIEATKALNICTLPSGFRPSAARRFICQGSVANKWLLGVETNGNVTFARYSTNDFASASAGSWLPFNATYFVD